LAGNGAGPQGDRFADQFHRVLRLPMLAAHHAEQVERIGLFRLPRHGRLIEEHGHTQLRGLMEPKGPSDLVTNGIHQGTSRTGRAFRQRRANDLNGWPAAIRYWCVAAVSYDE
jgi:hypothetical protein